MRVIAMEMKYALQSRKFGAAVGISILLLIISILKEAYIAVVNASYVVSFHNELFVKAASSQLVVLGLSVICALPFAASYIADAKSRYILFRLSRCSKRQYITGKIIAAFLSGGVTITVAYLIFYLLLLLAFGPVEIATSMHQDYWAGITNCGMVILVYFFVGGFFSLAAFLLGSLSMNYYIAYVASFILFYMLVILHERYVKGYGLLDPKVWLTDYGNFPFGVAGVIGITSLLSLLCSSCIYVYLDRRLLFE